MLMYGYRFIQAHRFERLRLWPSVRKALQHIRAVLRLIRAHITEAPCPTVYALDVTLHGYAVTYGTDASLGQALSLQGRWRFKDEGVRNFLHVLAP